jgi:hypothetical protein
MNPLKENGQEESFYVGVLLMETPYNKTNEKSGSGASVPAKKFNFIDI